MTESLICPNCSYENIVVGCGFCIQCGFDTKVREDNGPTEATSSFSSYRSAGSLGYSTSVSGGGSFGSASGVAVVDTSDEDAQVPSGEAHRTEESLSTTEETTVDGTSLSLEEKVQRVVEDNNFDLEPIDGGWRITVPLEDSRQQRVFITQGKNADRVRIVSPCGPVAESLGNKLLRLNASLPFGALAISSAGERHMTIVTETMFVESVSVEQLTEVVRSIGSTADTLEKKLKPQSDSL